MNKIALMSPEEQHAKYYQQLPEARGENVMSRQEQYFSIAVLLVCAALLLVQQLDRLNGATSGVLTGVGFLGVVFGLLQNVRYHWEQVLNAPANAPDKLQRALISFRNEQRETGFILLTCLAGHLGATVMAMRSVYQGEIHLSGLVILAIAAMQVLQVLSYLKYFNKAMRTVVSRQNSDINAQYGPLQLAVFNEQETHLYPLPYQSLMEMERTV